MGKDLRRKELGEGIYQQTNGTYCARFVDRFGKRKSKRSKKLQEVRQWLADATYINEHSDIEQATNMMVDAWFEYWIEIKRKTVRPNTVRNYTERYHRNIQKVMGKKLLTEVKPLHCQRIFTNMADSAYDTSLFKICEKAGINKFSMHVLRHTLATRCIEGGMMPKTLQKRKSKKKLAWWLVS